MKKSSVKHAKEKKTKGGYVKRLSMRTIHLLVLDDLLSGFRRWIMGLGLKFKPLILQSFFIKVTNYLLPYSANKECEGNETD